MITVRQIYQMLDQKAPFAIQMSWDNSGLLVGDPSAEVTRVLVSLDITGQAVAEAAEYGAQLIVSHHPLIFAPIKRVTCATDDLTGRILWPMISHGMAAICCHTNLDAVEGGVNSALAAALGLEQTGQLAQDGVDGEGRPYGIGRVGVLPEPEALPAFLARVRARLAPNGIRYVDGGRPVHRVAVGGGSCGGMLTDALRAGCDTFVTADLKYNQFLDAGDLGINLIDAGHFPTENVVVPILARWLREAFPTLEVRVSRRHGEAICYHMAENS